MKIFWLLFSILFFLHSNFVQAQMPTNAGIPESHHVLVVYKLPIDQNDSLGLISEAVMQYYVNARDIPSTNVLGLDSLVSKDITIDEVTHRVIRAQETDIIRDSLNHELGAGTPSFHAWRYYLDYVAKPIKEHIQNNNLTTTIRYIVLCKGVPFKLQASGDWSATPGNLAIDGLLCILNTDSYESFIENIVYPSSYQSNPYYNVDPNLTLDYRFLPDHFVGSGYKLSYLVSHLDGISYSVVEGIIDRSLTSDTSGTSYWILDDDPGWSSTDFIDARDKLQDLEFNVIYDNSNTWITSYPENVIGYTSWGTHAEDGNCEWEDSAWVKDSLQFTLSNGAVFNTYESFNGNSLTTLKWRYVFSPPPDCHHTQGLATQFTEIGGTGTMGHAWEPGISGVVKNNLFFPAYAIGYSLIDAIYQGMPYLAHQNMVVGDPLTRIYNCENTVITSNQTISSSNYTCDIIVPQSITLTIGSGATINFSRNAQLIVHGSLVINDATINMKGFSAIILKDGSTLTINNGAELNFENRSYFETEQNVNLNSTSSFSISFKDESNFITNGSLEINENNNIDFYDEAIFNVNNSLKLNPNTILDFNDNSKINIYGSLESLGQLSNEVIFNFDVTSATQFLIKDAVKLIMDYTIINNSVLHISNPDQSSQMTDLVIENSLFNDAITAIYILMYGNSVSNGIELRNITVDNFVDNAVNLYCAENVIIDNLYASGSQTAEESVAISMFKCGGEIQIENCSISNASLGIGTRYSEEENIPSSCDELIMELSVEICTLNTTIGIDLDIVYNNIFSAEFKGNTFNEPEIGIRLNGFDEVDGFTPVIHANNFYGATDGSSDFGISLTNCSGTDLTPKKYSIS